MKNQSVKWISLSLIFVSFFLTTSSVYAANNQFLDQVKKQYSDYESNTTSSYATFKKMETATYQKYKEKELQSLERLIKQTEKDLQALEQKLSQDITNLERQYHGQSAYTAKLTDYRNKISTTYHGSPMQQYSNSVKPTFHNSLMMKYKNATNENYLHSPMMKWRYAVDENYLHSPMMTYKNAVNHNFLNSPMSKLKNASNDSYTNSIMNRYKRDLLTQQQASSQWAETLKLERTNIQTISTNSKSSLRQIETSTKNDILTQKGKTVNGILDQRKKSLQTIHDLRLQYFGEGITFDSFIPDLGDINVILDEVWLSFDQPPIIRNGTTLVPMRAIFEELEADVKWDPKTRTVTATKQNTNITLRIDSKSASVNGRTITLQYPATILNGYTMVPLRFVSESLGSTVEWDADSKTVFIESN